MKKLILSAAAVMTFGLASAQLGTAGFKENWENSQYENTLYWWEPTAEFDFTTSRGVDGTTVTFTQDVGGFKPFGISFGDDSTETSPGVYSKFTKTIDMSGDQTFGFTIENLGNEDIQVRITLQDEAENNVDTYPTAIDGNGDTTTTPWEHSMEFDIASQETGVFMDTWEGAHKASYDGSGTFIGLSSDLDYSAISGLQITIINASDNASYAHEGLEDYVVKFTSIYAGDTTSIPDVEEPIEDADGDGVADADDLCANTAAGADVDADGCALEQLDTDADGVMDDVDTCASTPAGETADEFGCSDSQKPETSIAELKASISLSVGPNPASDIVVISYEGVGSVVVSDVEGTVVASGSGFASTTIDVSGLAAGTYYATVSVGDVLVTEAIVVE